MKISALYVQWHRNTSFLSPEKIQNDMTGERKGRGLHNPLVHLACTTELIVSNICVLCAIGTTVMMVARNSPDD